jgi:hypothetical protein
VSLTNEPRVDGTRIQSPVNYRWLSAFWALIGGSLLAFAGLIVLAFALSVTPFEIFETYYPQAPGAGWPWPVDGAWAALADVGPLLLVGTAVAVGVAAYVTSVIERPTARWPLGVCAVLVGWIPLAQSRHAGVLGVRGGVAFLAMWWTTHKTATLPRRGVPATRRLRVTLISVVAVVLTGVSLSYGTLHPIRASVSDDPGSVMLRDGVSARFPLFVSNDGPLAIRIVKLAAHDAPALSLARAEREGPRTQGPSIDSLYSPIRTPRISAGQQQTLWLTLAGPTRCASAPRSLDAIDVRLVVAGLERTQRVRLTRRLRISCPTTHRR